MKNFDYIICGAGCAGLSLALKFIDNQYFKNKKIALIDTDFNKKNDKTWCFWHFNDYDFNNLISKKWNSLLFKSSNFYKEFTIHPYYYNKIDSIDFYEFAFSKLKIRQNVELIEEEVLEIKNLNNLGFVETKNNKYSASYIFNTTFIGFNNKNLSTPNSLLQHFKGIEIETDEDFFNDEIATFMDFSIPQNLGTAFVYVLPTSSKKALIEYTFFTKYILKDNEYNNLLSSYIKNNLKLKQYKIVHTEFGIISMSDFSFKKYDNRIINIGTIGGAVKASTGFAFKNIQKQTNQIVTLLINNKKPYLKSNFASKKFSLYDRVLLEVIATKKMEGSKIFETIFKKNKPQLVLKFLDNETNILEDIKIMSSVPTKIFLPIAFKQFIKSFLK